LYTYLYKKELPRIRSWLRTILWMGGIWRIAKSFFKSW